MPGNFQFFIPLRNGFLLCVASVSICACGTVERLDLTTSNGNVNDAIQAATGPLQDLNLRRQEIPQLLKTAATNPYARPPVEKCEMVRAEVAQLDELLGPDMQPVGIETVSEQGLVDSVSSIEMPSQDDITDSAGNFIHDTVMDTIRSHTDIIPFRSIVRKITGADRHEKKVAMAYEAGKLRRAYLKGYAQEHFGIGCLQAHVVEAKAGTFDPMPLPEPAAGAAAAF